MQAVKNGVMVARKAALPLRMSLIHKTGESRHAAFSPPPPPTTTSEQAGVTATCQRGICVSPNVWDCRECWIRVSIAIEVIEVERGKECSHRGMAA